jgi:hypothetical protein
MAGFFLTFSLPHLFRYRLPIGIRQKQCGVANRLCEVTGFFGAKVFSLFFSFAAVCGRKGFGLIGLKFPRILHRFFSRGNFSFY